MRRDDDNVDKREVGEPEPRARKRPYVKPRLREYGSIAKLTQSGGSTRVEAGSPLKSCL